MRNVANPAEAALVKAWLTARSIARNAPAPVDDHGGWRVDTNLPDEARRYVFPGVTEGLRKAAELISEPRVLLKVFGSGGAVRPALPPRWRLQAEAYFMTLDGKDGGLPPLPPGYDMVISAADAVTAVRIHTTDGVLAASGFAAETAEAFVYDRIVTEPEHRRIGLGGAVMRALGASRQSATARQVLVATEEGRALYARLGWSVLSPWTTAVIPSA